MMMFTCRRISLFLVLFAVLASFTFAQQARMARPVTASPWDLDQDTAWTMCDLKLLIEMALDVSPALAQADYNRDGAVNVADVVLFSQSVIARGLLRGDVNLDGNINILDIMKVVRIAKGFDRFNRLADMNRDRRVDSQDVGILQGVVMRLDGFSLQTVGDNSQETEEVSSGHCYRLRSRYYIVDHHYDIDNAAKEFDLENLESWIAARYDDLTQYMGHDLLDKIDRIEAPVPVDHQFMETRIFAKEGVVLTGKDVEALQNFLLGQYADGWGEGLEQANFIIFCQPHHVVLYGGADWGLHLYGNYRVAYDGQGGTTVEPLDELSQEESGSICKTCNTAHAPGTPHAR